MKNEMRKKGNKMKNKNKKSKSWDRTWLSHTSMSNDLHLRPFGHDNSHKPMVLIVGIENVRAIAHSAVLG